MATVASRPSDRQPAYRPLSYIFKTPRYPNTLAGETSTIFNITQPSAAEILSFPAFKDTDVRVQHGAIPAGVLTVGQHIRIESTTNGLYTPFTDSAGVKYGIYRVRKVISTAYTVIDAPYNGDDGFGTIGKFYNNFRIKMDLEINGAISDSINVFPAGNYQSASFSEDVQDTLKRSMGPSIDPLNADDAAYTTSAWSTPGVTFSHQNYRIFYRELYDIPNAQGVNVLTETTVIKDATISAINAVHPYAAFRDRKITTLFTEDMDSTFLCANNDQKRFLTNAPRTQTIGRDEFAQLVALTDASTMRLQIVTYPEKDAGGTIIATTNTNLKTVDVTETLYVGTRHMGTGIITAATKSYTVQLLKNSGDRCSELRTYNIDDTCYQSSTRFFWLNTLGGIDSFTFTGHAGESISVKKSTFRKKEGLTIPTQNVVMYNSENTKKRYAGVRVNGETAEWLEELFMSNWVQIKYGKVNEFIPVLTNDQSTTIYDSRSSSYVIRFSYEYGFDQLSQVM